VTAISLDDPAARRLEATQIAEMNDRYRDGGPRSLDADRLVLVPLEEQARAVGYVEIRLGSRS